MIEITRLAGKGGKVRSDSSFNQLLVQVAKVFAIMCHIIEDCREVESKGSIKLAFYESWRDYSTIQVNDLIWFK